uniref:Uncharacterized protein n=1 Tax=Opuntia streptacantha TaxID=393608 RepID=A0A7C9CJU5_OPUST
MRNPDVLFLFSQKMFRLQSDRCYLLMITVCSCFTYFLFWSLASAYILFVSSKVLPIISSASLTWKHLSKILTAGNLVFMYMYECLVPAILHSDTALYLRLLCRD